MTKMIVRHHAGRGDGKDPRLGRERGRRLHADLTLARLQTAGAQRCAPAASAAGAAGRDRLPPSSMRGRDGRRGHWRRRALHGAARKRGGLRKAMQRKSTIAFLMALPLILLIALLVLYPAFYSIHLATLNKSMERFVGFGNFTVPVQARDVLDGGAAVLHLRHHGGDLQSADRLHRRAFRAQHPGQGPAQVARHAAGAVGDPAGDELPRLAVAVRSVLQRVQLDPGAVRHRAGRRGPATPTGRASR